MPLLTALNHPWSSPTTLSLVTNGAQYAMPIFSFGDPSRAGIATLSINPSDKEFLKGTGQPLPAQSARFHSPWLATPPFTQGDVAAIQNECKQYFTRRSPSGKATSYSWFDTMQALLSLAKGSPTYATGKVCHLDLSPWATRPIWRQLSPATRGLHIALGVPVLLHQLGFPGGNLTLPRRSTIKKLLLDGATAQRECFSALQATPKQVRNYTHVLQSARGKVATLKIETGKIFGIDYLAWNLPLTQPFGRTAMPYLAPHV